MLRKIIKLKFDEVIMQVEAGVKVCDNLKFIYRNYITDCNDKPSIYFRIDGSAEEILTNRNIIHIFYSFDGKKYKNWTYRDTIFPPLLIEPLKGRYLVLHGCCVSKNDQAIAFLGKSMTGKTKIMLHLLEQGYKMLSDDLIFFFFFNLVHAYKKPMGFRTLIANEHPQIYRKILELNSKIAFHSFLKFTTYLIHAEDLFEDIYDENYTKISKVIILSNGVSDEITNIKTLNSIYDLKGLCCNSGIESQELIMRLIDFIDKTEIIKCTPEKALDNVEIGKC